MAAAATSSLTRDRKDKLISCERLMQALMTAPSPRHTLPAQRRQAILRAVRSGSSHVSDLAQSFGVSEMTVRRDLARLPATAS